MPGKVMLAAAVMAAAVLLSIPAVAAPRGAQPAGAAIELFEGWNPTGPWPGAGISGVPEIIQALDQNLSPPSWVSIARNEGGWKQTFKAAPLPAFNTLTAIEPGEVYWIFVNEYAVLTVPGGGEPLALLNEVGFAPAPGDVPFVEVVNAGGGSLSLGGLQLGNADGQTFTLPAGAPPLSEGEVALVVFDGGSGVEGNVVHASPDGFLDADSGSVALRQGGATLDEVAWGEEPGAIRSSRGGLLPEVEPGSSVGRVPDGDRAWVFYLPDEATPGEANQLPAVTLMMPGDGSFIFLSEVQGAGTEIEIELSWYPVPGAIAYLVQVATDEDFQDVLFETVVEAPPVSVTLPELDTYFWRVQPIFPSGDGPFSAPNEVVVDEEPPPGSAVLQVPLIQQHKDTSMLLLESTMEHGAHAWDVAHPGLDVNDLADNMNCALATVVMVNHYFGGNLSQDRLGFHVLGPLSAGPEFDLNWDRGFSANEMSALIQFALGVNAPPLQPTSLDQFWADVQASILAGRPVPIGWMGGQHASLVVGYSQIGASRAVMLNDPWFGAPYWRDINTLGLVDYWLLAGPITAQNDEPAIHQDSDGDGVVDFDETQRFGTSPGNVDTDDDLRSDKNDIRESVFDETYGWAWASPRNLASPRDWDQDGRPTELDPDNDHPQDQTCPDGLEDLNLDGVYDQGTLETYNFDPEDDTCFLGTWFRIAHVTKSYVDGFVVVQDQSLQVRFVLNPLSGSGMVAAGSAEVQGQAELEYYDFTTAEGGGFTCWIRYMTPEPLQWTADLEGTLNDGTLSFTPDPEESPPWTLTKQICSGPSFEEDMPPVVWEGVSDAQLDEDGYYYSKEDQPLFDPDPDSDTPATITGEHYVEIEIIRRAPDE